VLFVLLLTGCLLANRPAATPTPTSDPLYYSGIDPALPADPVAYLPALDAAAVPANVNVVSPGDPAAPVISAPQPTPTNPPPMIFAFSVTPSQGVEQGDIISAQWQASGVSAQLCMASNDYYPGQCTPVNLSGSQEFTVPWSEGIFHIFLVVSGASSPTVSPSVTSSVEIDLGCGQPWGFVALQASGRCPGASEVWSAVAQPFERGWIIWSGNSYLILADQSSYEGKYIDMVLDPLTVVEDTSAQYVAPLGLLAPTSGIGIVWRGDIAGSTGYADLLGWARAPEFPYNPIYQCWALRNTSTLSNTACYLTHPDGGIIELVVSGGTHFYWQMHDPNR
jgi:hypothetical protein